MSKITTHILDTVLGKPAAGITVALEVNRKGLWAPLASSATDGDGRCRDLGEELASGRYRLTFDTGAYFDKMQRKSIFPEISITLHCADEAHYHLPLLLSDNSYTTYRGS
ncbi:MAG TPA: hydroxyisourate hydrolase [Terracidiphilus sp.]|jgi:5-hydroxyisourate hydrolase|nr:hydroxyisourate hydrolase [Terracidiphilus sp.]